MTAKAKGTLFLTLPLLTLQITAIIGANQKENNTAATVKIIDIIIDDKKTNEQKIAALNSVLNAVNIDAKDEMGETPLLVASSTNNENLIKYFVTHGATVTIADKNKVTPLHWASRHNNLNMVKYLIEHGADPIKENLAHKRARDNTKDPAIKAYLELVEDFYYVIKNKMGFDTFVKKHLTPDNKVNRSNFDDINKLLQWGTKKFTQQMQNFATLNSLPGLTTKNELRWLLLELANRSDNERKIFWLKESLPYLDGKVEYEYQNLSSFDEALTNAINKLPSKDQENLTKEKNKILQQRKGFFSLTKKQPTVKPGFKDITVI